MLTKQFALRPPIVEAKVVLILGSLHSEKKFQEIPATGSEIFDAPYGRQPDAGQNSPSHKLC